jgi:hypothetical protein
MKQKRISFGNLLILFVVGFLAGSYFLRPQRVGIPIQSGPVVGAADILATAFSLFFLLVICIVGAWAISWGYLKNELPGRPIVVFGISFSALIGSAFISIWLEFQQTKYILSHFKDQFGGDSISPWNMDYFSMSFGSVFMSFGMMVIALLWIFRWRKVDEIQALPSVNMKKWGSGILLTIVTILFFGAALVNTINSIYSALLFNSFNQGESITEQSLLNDDKPDGSLPNGAFVAYKDFISA